MKIFNRSVLLALVALISASSFTAQAQGIKIGYADPDVLVVNMDEYQTIQQRLMQEGQTYQTAMQALAEEFQADVDRYQRQQPLLSAERRAERENELATRQQELQQTASQKEQELAQMEQDLLSPLLDTVQQAIDEIAKQKGLVMVVRSAALLYVDESVMVNIMPDVARKLGIPFEDTADAN